jgi:hypothetical protein
MFSKILCKYGVDLLKELQLLNVNSDYEEGEIQAFW